MFTPVVLRRRLSPTTVDVAVDNVGGGVLQATSGAVCSTQSKK